MTSTKAAAAGSGPKSCIPARQYVCPLLTYHPGSPQVAGYQVGSACRRQTVCIYLLRHQTSLNELGFTL